MEIVNILVILSSILITYIWALNKRYEINTTKISYLEDIDEEATSEDTLLKQKRLINDKEQLEYVADLF